MLANIRGKVIWTSNKYLVIETGGLGYKVFATSDVLESQKQNKNEVSLFLYQVVRDDTSDLYGFLSREDLDFFELLINTVSGVGPKSALGILNVSPVSSLKHAIVSGDIAHLTKVSGIGKKLAEKIVLELKDKVDEDYGKSEVSLRDEVETLEALKAMGYSHKEARDVLQQISTKTKDSKERIREALKVLGK